ncbi:MULTISPECIES: hypothetical protein [unclassified Oceanispirochaeta]|uniref:hypothetical protein n=1 Tax=unclassified Oceanispirochaeta TaxID=2635722 RepID=UPI0018AC4D53|nr:MULTISPECIES: hypothetical protein [unclassified Oceanispirochaeta]MBF9016112.1 hypothetical protein [Oceanispirochaeta sp. M2]
MKNRTFLLLMIILSLFFSCSTAPVVEKEPVVEEVAVAEPELIVEPEPVVEEAPAEEVVVSDESGFEVSVEVYKQTLDEMRELIKKLNGIISDRNYEKWKQYLSEEYIQTYNDKTTLKGITEGSKILSENKIELLSLKDYFEWVVVPSRSKASVDDIVFKDDSHLTVYMLIKEKRTILYQLERIDDNWLISVW